MLSTQGTPRLSFFLSRPSRTDVVIDGVMVVAPVLPWRRALTTLRSVLDLVRMGKDRVLASPHAFSYFTCDAQVLSLAGSALRPTICT